MRDLWRRLEAHLKKHAPDALKHLNPPATASQIRKAEKQLGIQFPADFAESLKVHDGQPPETGSPPYSILLVPQEHDKEGYYRATFGGLASLPFIVDATMVFRDAVEEIGEWAGEIEFEGPVRRDGKLSFVIFVDPGSGDLLGLDLNPDDAGKVGQVVSILHDPEGFLVLANSYREWFETLVSRYESGRYVFVERDGEWEAVDNFEPAEEDGPDEEPGDDNILQFPR